MARNACCSYRIELLLHVLDIVPASRLTEPPRLVTEHIRGTDERAAIRIGQIQCSYGAWNACGLIGKTSRQLNAALEFFVAIVCCDGNLRIVRERVRPMCGNVWRWLIPVFS